MNLLDPKRQVALQLQRKNGFSNYQCSQHCLGMLLGIPAAEVCRKFRHYTGTTWKQMRGMLKAYGFQIGDKVRGESPHPVAMLCWKDAECKGHSILQFHGTFYCPSWGINPRYMSTAERGRIVYHIPILGYKGKPTPPTFRNKKDVAAAQAEKKLDEYGPNGRRLCKCGCKKEVAPPRRVWFSQDCINRWLIENVWADTRRYVFKRDKGICAQCSLDTVALQLRLSQAGPMERSLLRTEHPRLRLDMDYWQADHIQERNEGGSSKPENIQTLCVPCHQKKTDAYNSNRQRGRKKVTIFVNGIFTKPHAY